ncbi:hypothetical protein BDV93DRAFT_480150 [Ceratobasidium sp. AG-I]|nr:hypothetical protein BDV93DRAFT_480150 [Ceratobasidium sp. AG-I]
MSQQSNPPSTTSRTVERTINAGYTQGGDTILRSLDGVDFHVHSVILSLASPVLADMFNLTTRRDIVTVGETAEVLALMLSFIYPGSPRPVSSFETLRVGIHAADKYQLEHMRNWLRERLVINGSPVSISTDPLAALAFAIEHGFREEINLASSFASTQHDFRKVNSLVELANAVPSSTAFIQMIGVPSARTSILVDVLFNFHKAPIVSTTYPLSNFICPKCRPTYQSVRRRSPPEWLARWSYHVFEGLSRRPISESAEMFNVDFVSYAIGRDGIPMPAISACECLTHIANNKSYFNAWAEQVRIHLVTRLAELEQLHNL